jgi:outer membrane lipoprotein SlyB
MQKHSMVLIVLGVLVLPGCTRLSQWEPPVDDSGAYVPSVSDRGADRGAVMPQGKRGQSQKRFYADPLVEGEVASYDDPRTRIAKDKYECRQLAMRASGLQGQVVQEAAFGALVGASLGALTGAVTGFDPGKGAAAGAGIIGLLSGGVSAVGQDRRYRQAFIVCLRQRGHRVIAEVR